MDTVQWPQEIVVKPLDEIVTTNTSTSACPKPNPSSSSSSSALDRKQRPEKDQALNCPRCNSTNTKFCYYNNYSLSQPRYFCKTCRRYWTAGGSLRNIPVGGGSRKNKRSAPSSSSKSLKLPDLVTHHQQNPKIEAADQGNVSDGQDLNLGFPATHQISALELITGISSSRGLNSFMPIGSGPDPCGVFGSGYNPMQELNLKPLSFAVDGLGAGFSGLEEENGSLLFPFEDLKQVSSTSNNSDVDHQQSNKQGHHDSTSAGYWTGILGGSW